MADIEGHGGHTAKRPARSTRVAAAWLCVMGVFVGAGLSAVSPAVATALSTAPAPRTGSPTVRPPTATSLGSDWSAYLDGSAHWSFNVNATAITTTNIGNLQPVWRWTPPKSPNSGTTDLLASPTVSNGVVYIGAKDGYFFAVNEATQATVWSDFLGIDTPKRCPVCGTQGITSTAAVATDPATGKPTVYVDSPYGFLYALDAASGVVVWKGLVDTPSTKVNDYYAWGSPLVSNGKVYIGISSDNDSPLVPGGLVAFDQGTGARVATWNSLPQGELGGSIWSSAAALPDGSIIVTTGNGYNKSEQPLYDESIVRLDPTTLHVLDYWQVPSSQQTYDADFGASPTLFSATIGGVVTPMVGACNKNGIYYAFRQDDLSAGPVWQHRMTVPYTAGAAECDAAATWDGTNLIEGGGAATTFNGMTFTGSLQSLDPSTGKPRWKTGLSGTIVGSPSEDGAGVVAAPVYQSTDGQQGVYLLAATTGAIIGFIVTPGAALFGQAVFSGNDLVLGAGAGLGVTDYEITTPGPALASPDPSVVSVGAKGKVRVTGSGFSGDPKVFISGGRVSVQNVIVDAPSSLSFIVVVSKSATTGPRNVSVVEPGSPDTNDSCANCLAVIAAPTVTAIAPTTVAHGSTGQVTISGTGFAPGARLTGPSGVTFSTLTAVNSTTIIATMTVSAAATIGTSLPVTVSNDAAAGYGKATARVLTIT